MAQLLLTVVRSNLHKNISFYYQRSFYKAGKRTGVENDKFIHFNYSTGTHSIDDFNAKIKVAILQQRQDWEPPQIKDLRLVIPEDYTFIVSNNIFIALGIPDNYLEKTTLIRSTLPPGS